MFCSKCGNQLEDSDQFCAKCGAPVAKQEAPQERPAAMPNDPYSPAAGGMATQPIYHQAAAPVPKKSKKGLIISFSVGGAVLAVILAVALIFVFRPKTGGSQYGHSSIPLGASEIVYDDEYIFYLDEEEGGDPASIMRIGNQSDAQPEILYEADLIRGDGWSQYPLGALFLWNDKICFFERRRSGNGDYDLEYDFNWVSKDGKETGTLVSYEQLNAHDNMWSNVSEVFFCEDSLVLSTWLGFYRLDLNTGALCSHQELLGLRKPICFVAYDQGYYYYFIPDPMNNLMGETLYRKKVDSEQEEIGNVPVRNNDDRDMYTSFVSRGNYLYFADKSSIFRIHKETGCVENLASYEETYNRFALTDQGIYYFRDMSLYLLDLETMEEAAFHLPDVFGSIPDLIYAGDNGSCWFNRWEDSFEYYHFSPDGKGGSFEKLGDSNQDALAGNQEAVNQNALYADVVENAIAAYGTLSFGGSENECYAQGVFKIDLKDFNQDGTDELVLLYTKEGDGIFPYMDVWTVKHGEAVQLFSGKSKSESHESEIALSLYENAGYYYIPVYDSLDSYPMYIHLYGFDENGEFGEVYQYENNAFYMNQLPDGMEFTECEKTHFYANTQSAYYDGFENVKEEMMESLQADMKYMLNELGIAAPQISAYGYAGDWVWKWEDSDMEGSLHLEAVDEATLSGSMSIYGLFHEQVTLSLSGDVGTVTSEYGDFNGTVRFQKDAIVITFEDQVVYHDYTISEMFGSAELRFVAASASTQVGFDVTSMLGEWTLEIAQPGTESVNHYLIRLNADGTMDLRAEDGSWLDYTYTMDETHFYFTYGETGGTSGGTYTVSGDTIRLSEED